MIIRQEATLKAYVLEGLIPQWVILEEVILEEVTV